jgi:hypothetical protein
MPHFYYTSLAVELKEWHFFHYVMLWMFPTSSQCLRMMQNTENWYLCDHRIHGSIYIYVLIKTNFTTDPINQQRCSRLRKTMSYIFLSEQSKVHGIDYL